MYRRMRNRDLESTRTRGRQTERSKQTSRDRETQTDCSAHNVSELGVLFNQKVLSNSIVSIVSIVLGRKVFTREIKATCTNQTLTECLGL